MKNFNLVHNLPLVISLLVVTVSLPLALFIGLTQQTNLESSAKTGKFSWEFNQKGNLEGWTGAGFAKNVTVNNGYLKAVTVDTKGKEIMIKSALFGPQLENFSGQNYPQLKLRMRVTNPQLPKEVREWSDKNLQEVVTGENLNNLPFPQAKGKMILEWYYQSNQKTKAKLSSQLFIDTVEDGRYHTYNIDLTNEPAWAKYFIKQIKLTPTVSNPRTIYLDWVRFNKQKVTITPTPIPVSEVRLTEIGRVIKYQPKLTQVSDQENMVLGLTTEDVNDSPIVEYDEPELEQNQILGVNTQQVDTLASLTCVKDQENRPVCLTPEIYPICPNGQPVSSIDPCGCPRLVCPPTITPTPPQLAEKFALQTEDGRVYVLETNSFVIPPCKGQDCQLLGMPQYFLDFSSYVGKTVMVEGVLEALPAQAGNFPKDTVCTLSYPPTCFPGYPYPAEGTLRASTVQLAEKYVTNQTLQGYLYQS
ncbi:hypothetical protein HY345_04485, partial [Candidatus Microgenomates bacterium]|nr:hypothetical protein [Candidatus Microgenomates bacterium]